MVRSIYLCLIVMLCSKENKVLGNSGETRRICLGTD